MDILGTVILKEKLSLEELSMFVSLHLVWYLFSCYCVRASLTLNKLQHIQGFKYSCLRPQYCLWPWGSEVRLATARVQNVLQQKTSSIAHHPRSSGGPGSSYQGCKGLIRDIVHEPGIVLGGETIQSKAQSWSKHIVTWHNQALLVLSWLRPNEWTNEALRATAYGNHSSVWVYTIRGSLQASRDGAVHCILPVGIRVKGTVEETKTTPWVQKEMLSGW